MNKKLGQRNSGAIRRSLRPIIRARRKQNAPILAFIVIDQHFSESKKKVA